MENSVVRENLMVRKDYTPYCGDETCKYRWPRTTWDGSKNQFTCKCGWVSQLPTDFVERYKAKWNK